MLGGERGDGLPHGVAVHAEAFGELPLGRSLLPGVFEPVMMSRRSSSAISRQAEYPPRVLPCVAIFVGRFRRRGS